MSIDNEKLPPNWSVATLREVSTKIVDGSHNPPQKQSAGRPMLSARNVENNQIVFNDYRLIADEDFDREHLRTKVTSGDVLLTIVGTIGRTTVVLESTPEFTLQRSVAVITPKELLPKFLMYQFQAPFFQKYFEVSARGTAQKGVYLKTLGASPVIVAPLEDQKRIVAEIEIQFSRLDETVASLKRIQANLKRYKAAVLKAAVEGKLTEQWRKDHPDVEPADQLLKRILAERRAKWEAEELAKMKAKDSVGAKHASPDSWKKKYKEPAEPDTANLPELPDVWVWAKSDQLFSFVTSGSRGWAIYYSETGPIFLRMGNLDHDTIKLDLSDIQRVQPPEGAEGLRTRVVAGDILVSITADVGMIGMVPEGFEEAFINQHVSLARPLSGFNSTFLAWFLACKSGQDQFKELQRGATKVGLGLDDIKSVNVPMPPVEEQKAILAEIDRRLSVTEELESTIKTNLKRADRLRQTILQKAFSGGLV